MSALWESSESVISRFSPPSYKDFLQYFSSLTNVERRVATETLWNGHYAEERYIRSTTGTSAMRQNFCGARCESADSGIQSESASVGINRRIYGRNAFQGCGSYYSTRGHTIQANLVLVNEAYSEGYWGPPFEGMETESVQFFRTKTETAAVETICALVGVRHA